MAKAKSEQTKKAAVDLVTKGESISKVAKTYGVSVAAVRLWKSKYTPTTVKAPSQSELHIHMPTNLGKIYGALKTLTEAGLIH